MSDVAELTNVLLGITSSKLKGALGVDYGTMVGIIIYYIMFDRVHSCYFNGLILIVGKQN